MIPSAYQEPYFTTTWFQERQVSSKISISPIADQKPALTIIPIISSIILPAPPVILYAFLSPPFPLHWLNETHLIDRFTENLWNIRFGNDVLVLHQFCSPSHSSHLSVRTISAQGAPRLPPSVWIGMNLLLSFFAPYDLKSQTLFI